MTRPRLAMEHGGIPTEDSDASLGDCALSPTDAAVRQDHLDTLSEHPHLPRDDVGFRTDDSAL